MVLSSRFSAPGLDVDGVGEYAPRTRGARHRGRERDRWRAGSVLRNSVAPSEPGRTPGDCRTSREPETEICRSCAGTAAPLSAPLRVEGRWESAPFMDVR